ncbi:hypothetical protein EVAR_43612_1 [Eumeta japonica]|uniref:Uncharacterized protein n=1 Tax=Eumeta variegata TaxID=151549 RepID=A0A4C1XGU6_EUMVA|nr:hypothetical protein EVAR_43612_1 [Eumeta japonica]
MDTRTSRSIENPRLTKHFTEVWLEPLVTSTFSVYLQNIPIRGRPALRQYKLHTAKFKFRFDNNPDGSRSFVRKKYKTSSTKLGLNPLA